ncbi:MAG TPA: hypothetical protein VF883_06450 [Thermoanaerobaculia bacterium]|jgi:hypothetical protein
MRNAVATLLLVLTCSAAAQTFEQSTSLRLSETPMSARAAAMGGAGDPLGVDAADFATNPALLASVKRPLLSLSGAQTTYDILRLDFDPGEGPFFETEVVLDHTNIGQSFAHVAAAIPLRGFVLGVYARNEPSLRDGSVDYAEGTADFEPACPLGFDCNYALLLGASAFERRERRYGVSAAFERGAFSFGAGAELQDVNERYEVVRGSIPLSFGLERVVRRTSGRKIVPNAGVRWRVTPRIAVAAAYNGAAEHERVDDACAFQLTSRNCTTRFVRLGQSSVGGADAWRASLAVAPVNNLLLTGEVVRRNYSKLSDDPAYVVTTFEPVSYRDATELHAGAEYRLGRLPLTLRAGWWREPSKIDGSDLLGIESEDVAHRTYGIGIDVGAARVDIAYDDADAPAMRRTLVGISYGFGR